MKIPPILLILAMGFVGGAILYHSINYDKNLSVSAILPSPTPPLGVKIIKATYGPPLGFFPLEFTTKVGVPTRLEVLATENGIGCMGSIMLPELLPGNIQGFIKGKTNVFEFTPTTPGKYTIACAMGIPHGEIIVK